MQAFHPEQLDLYTWTDQGPGGQWADVMHHDIGVLYDFLGLNEENDTPAPFTLKPRLLICTSRLSCSICPEEPIPRTLRKRAKMEQVHMLDASFAWVTADLFVAHCPACRSDYYPDRITYRGENNERLQKLEYNATYIRISKHGMWAHRQIAIAQEKALLRFHAGWSNFADWVNDTVKSNTKMTYRQSQRLFIENFSRRLLVHHEKEAFSCLAHPSMQLLAECVSKVIGCDGGSIASAMKHGCMDCTHRKRYRSDLINEGAILEGAVDGVAVEGTTDERDEAEVRILFPIYPLCVILKPMAGCTTSSRGKYTTTIFAETPTARSTT
jgi:hypothetical protein